MVDELVLAMEAFAGNAASAVVLGAKEARWVMVLCFSVTGQVALEFVRLVAVEASEDVLLRVKCVRASVRRPGNVTAVLSSVDMAVVGWYLGCWKLSCNGPSNGFIWKPDRCDACSAATSQIKRTLYFLISKKKRGRRPAVLQRGPVICCQVCNPAISTHIPVEECKPDWPWSLSEGKGRKGCAVVCKWAKEQDQ